MNSYNTYGKPVQCAAVNNHFSEMIEAPQACLPLRCIDACHGTCLISIGNPPTILPSKCGRFLIDALNVLEAKIATSNTIHNILIIFAKNNL